MKKYLKVVAIITVVCFLTTQCTWADPGARIEIANPREIPNFLSLDIPADLASIDEIYEAPVKQDPKFVLHIQNAHANYQAQIKIKQLLEYLNKKYAIKTVFVEGASEKLNADYLRLFPDKERNLKLSDNLAKQGELTGAELYLLEAPPEVEAIGIENASLYKQNYNALKKVFGAETDVEKFFRVFDVRLEQVASKTFTPDTRGLIADWKSFEMGRREFLPYVKSLVKQAKKVLNVDLESLFAQVGWPQITRLLVIQTMEKDVERNKALAERDSLVKFLREKRTSEALVRAIENFQEGNISMGRAGTGKDAKEILPRWVLEQLAAEAGPRGFKFSDYPNFSLYAGYVVLKNELDPKALFEEIEFLFAKMLDTLAKEPAQKNLLELYRDGELLRKLLHLELNRTESRKVQDKQKILTIESMVGRLTEAVAVSKNDESLMKQKVMPPDFSKRMSELFTSGIDFYDLARKREDAFFVQIQKKLSEENIGKAVLITGGYHTDGLSEIFRDHDISYGIVTPRLSEKSDEKLYRDTMLQRTKTRFDIATIENAVTMTGDPMGKDGSKTLRLVVSAALDAAADITTTATMDQNFRYMADKGAVPIMTTRGGSMTYVVDGKTGTRTLVFNDSTKTWDIAVQQGTTAMIRTATATSQSAVMGEKATIVNATAPASRATSIAVPSLALVETAAKTPAPALAGRSELRSNWWQKIGLALMGLALSLNVARAQGNAGTMSPNLFQLPNGRMATTFEVAINGVRTEETHNLMNWEARSGYYLNKGDGGVFIFSTNSPALARLSSTNTTAGTKMAVNVAGGTTPNAPVTKMDLPASSLTMQDLPANVQEMFIRSGRETIVVNDANDSSLREMKIEKTGATTGRSELRGKRLRYFLGEMLNMIHLYQAAVPAFIVKQFRWALGERVNGFRPFIGTSTGRSELRTLDIADINTLIDKLKATGRIKAIELRAESRAVDQKGQAVSGLVVSFPQLFKPGQEMQAFHVTHLYDAMALGASLVVAHADSTRRNELRVSEIPYQPASGRPEFRDYAGAARAFFERRLGFSSSGAARAELRATPDDVKKLERQFWALQDRVQSGTVDAEADGQLAAMITAAERLRAQPGVSLNMPSEFQRLGTLIESARETRENLRSELRVSEREILQPVTRRTFFAASLGLLASALTVEAGEAPRTQGPVQSAGAAALKAQGFPQFQEYRLGKAYPSVNQWIDDARKYQRFHAWTYFEEKTPVERVQTVNGHINNLWAQKKSEFLAKYPAVRNFSEMDQRALWLISLWNARIFGSLISRDFIINQSDLERAEVVGAGGIPTRIGMISGTRLVRTGGATRVTVHPESEFTVMRAMILVMAWDEHQRNTRGQIDFVLKGLTTFPFSKPGYPAATAFIRDVVNVRPPQGKASLSDRAVINFASLGRIIRGAMVVPAAILAGTSLYYFGKWFIARQERMKRDESARSEVRSNIDTAIEMLATDQENWRPFIQQLEKDALANDESVVPRQTIQSIAGRLSESSRAFLVTANNQVIYLKRHDFIFLTFLVWLAYGRAMPSYEIYQRLQRAFLKATDNLDATGRPLSPMLVGNGRDPEADNKLLRSLTSVSGFRLLAPISRGVDFGFRMITRPWFTLLRGLWGQDLVLSKPLGGILHFGWRGMLIVGRISWEGGKFSVKLARFRDTAPQRLGDQLYLLEIDPKGHINKISQYNSWTGSSTPTMQWQSPLHIRLEGYDESTRSEVRAVLPTDINLAGKRILAVDDEPMILEVVKAILESEGAIVIFADTVDGARQAISENDFDVLVTDRILHGQDTFQKSDGVIKSVIVEAARAKNNSIAALVMSGGTEGLSAVEGKAVAQSSVGFLSKPFSGVQLVDAVKTAVASRSEVRGAVDAGIEKFLQWVQGDESDWALETVADVVAFKIDPTRAVRNALALANASRQVEEKLVEFGLIDEPALRALDEAIRSRMRSEMRGQEMAQPQEQFVRSMRPSLLRTLMFGLMSVVGISQAPVTMTNAAEAGLMPPQMSISENGTVRVEAPYSPGAIDLQAAAQVNGPWRTLVTNQFVLPGQPLDFIQNFSLNPMQVYRAVKKAATPLPTVQNLWSFDSNDGTTITNTVNEQNFLTVNVNGARTASYAGPAFNFADNPINLVTNYPTGLRLFAASPNLSRVKIEFKDGRGNVFAAYLSNLTPSGKGFNIPLSFMTQYAPALDQTHITEITLVIEGQGQKTLYVDWGNFNYIPSIPPGNQTADITPLPTVNPTTFTGPTGEVVTNNVTGTNTLSMSYASTNATGYAGTVFEYTNNINFQNLYPNGLTFSIASPNLDHLKVEVKDANTNTWTGMLSSITPDQQKYTLPLDQIARKIDPTQVRQMVYVFEGQGPKSADLVMGSWNFIPDIPPGNQAANITPLPFNNFGTFNSTNASVLATAQNTNVVMLNYAGPSADSYGGVYSSFTNSVDFASAFPNGLTFSVSSTNATILGIEIKDENGNVWRGNISGISATAQKHTVNLNQIFGIDTTKIREIVFTAVGEGQKTYVIELGPYSYVPPILPAANQGALITPLPVNNNTGSYTDSTNTVADVTVIRTNALRLSYSGINVASFGGVFSSFTNNVDFASQFPNGLTFSVGSLDATSLVLEIKDENGRSWRGNVSDITETPQKYTVNLNQIYGIDTTKIREIVFTAAGEGQKTYVIELGPYDYVPIIPPGNQSTAITPLPQVNPTTFTGPTGESVFNDITGTNTLTASYTSTNFTGYAGTVFEYTNNINFQSLYPNGLTFSIASPNLNHLKVEVKDANTNTWRGMLGGITPGLQKYTLSLNLLQQKIDPTQVRQVVYVFEGQGPKSADLVLGSWDYVPSIPPGNQGAAITPLPQVNPMNFTGPGGEVVFNNITGTNTMSMSYSSTNATGYAGTVFEYTNNINFQSLYPNGLTFSIASPNLDHLKVEVKDANTNTWTGILSGITPSSQKYTLPLDQMARKIDPTQVRQMVYVFEGQGPKNADLVMGSWNFAPDVPPGNQTASVTPLPFVGLGNFVSSTNVVGELKVTETNTFTFNYVGENTASFGGVFANYTNNVDLPTQFPNGITFSLGSTNAPVVGYEIQDAEGKTWRANLTGVLNTPQNYTIDINNVQGINVHEARTFSFTLTGPESATINVKQGRYDFTPDIGGGGAEGFLGGPRSEVRMSQFHVIGLGTQIITGHVDGKTTQAREYTLRLDQPINAKDLVRLNLNPIRQNGLNAGSVMFVTALDAKGKSVGKMMRILVTDLDEARHVPFRDIGGKFSKLRIETTDGLMLPAQITLRGETVYRSPARSEVRGKLSANIMQTIDRVVSAWEITIAAADTIQTREEDVMHWLDAFAIRTGSYPSLHHMAVLETRNDFFANSMNALEDSILKAETDRSQRPGTIEAVKLALKGRLTRSEVREAGPQLPVIKLEIEVRQELVDQVRRLLAPEILRKLESEPFKYGTDTLNDVVAKIVVPAFGNPTVEQVVTALTTLVALKTGEMDWTKFLESEVAKSIMTNAVISVSTDIGGVLIVMKELPDAARLNELKLQLGMNPRAVVRILVVNDKVSVAEQLAIQADIRDNIQQTTDYRGSLIDNRMTINFANTLQAAQAIRTAEGEVFRDLRKMDPALTAEMDRGEHLVLLIEDMPEMLDKEFSGTVFDSQKGNKAYAGLRGLLAMKAAQLNVSIKNMDAMALLNRQLGDDVLKRVKAYFGIDEMKLAGLAKLWSDILTIQATSKAA